MAGGGTLTISTSNGHRVQVKVSDTGSGIAQEHMHRIYDPFFTTKNKPNDGHSGGTGLGLSVTYGIIQEHAGKIRVDSAPGRGTTFTMEFPMIRKAVMPEAAISRVTSEPRRTSPQLGSVLIIDDEAAIRESLQTLLELEGYEVETANDGEEGLARVAEHPFDLVLLDFALPERNGMEVLRDIRERDAELPVIMITAYGTVENAVNAMQAGATNFIQKPWDNEKLLADIRTAVGRRRAEEEIIQLKRALKQRYNFEHIIGKSEPMLRIFDLVAQVAPSRSTVLLQGESGTGKELIAKAIHMNSPRKDRAFRAGQYRLDADRPAGVHAVRPRQRRVHQRHRQQERPVRSRRSRHPVPRRDRHHGPGHAGQDSARAAGPQVHAPGRSQRNPGGCAHHRRHQRRSAAAGERRQVPRRSFLSAERHHHRSAAAAPAQERYSAAGRALHREVRPGERAGLRCA